MVSKPEVPVALSTAPFMTQSPEHPGSRPR